ncbi:RibD family protein, partial [Saccharothrix lopnurensis]
GPLDSGPLDSGPLDSGPLDSGPLDSGPLDSAPLGSGAGVDLGALLDDLGARGVRRLMVEGGTRVHTAFLAAGLADELRVAVAPLLIGQADAPRFVDPTAFPGGPAHRFHLEDVSRLGDVAVLRYFPKR